MIYANLISLVVLQLFLAIDLQAFDGENFCRRKYSGAQRRAQCIQSMEWQENIDKEMEKIRKGELQLKTCGTEADFLEKHATGLDGWFESRIEVLRRRNLASQQATLRDSWKKCMENPEAYVPTRIGGSEACEGEACGEASFNKADSGEAPESEYKENPGNDEATTT